MGIYSIYRATNLINGKIYIGFDSNWPNRKKDHQRDYATSNLIFHRAIKKHGWDNFSWEVIYQSPDGLHTLNEMESFFIREYNSHVFSQNSNGYNMALGGGGTLGMSQSGTTKKKISKAKLGKKYTPKLANCRFCQGVYAINQLPVHERSCNHNPNKEHGHTYGRKNNGTFKTCQYCCKEFRTTSLGRHETTCINNPEKIKLTYSGHKQKTSTCEHCGKHGGVGVMNRYHHGKCKLLSLISS
jgi:group I intron endonuclease